MLSAVRLASFAALAFLLLPSGADADDNQTAPANPHCPFGSKDQVEITGVIQNMMTGHEEPQEQINSYFDLITSGEPCGDGRIMVFAPGITPCFNGERATLRGNYYAPDKDFLDIAMMDAREVKCSPQ